MPIRGFILTELIIKVRCTLGDEVEHNCSFGSDYTMHMEKSGKLMHERLWWFSENGMLYLVMDTGGHGTNNDATSYIRYIKDT